MGVVAEERVMAPLADPLAAAVRLKPPERRGLAERFHATDPSPGTELTANRHVARLVRSRKFQFFLILPNQVIFWAVILVGLAGTVVPGLNFGTAITWYIWFCLVFVTMVVVGRAWCAMCPFGGFAEWVQRRSFFNRTQKALGLGWKFPEPAARLGFLIPVASFLVLTWIEEFFNIAGPGTPSDTSWMVVGIVSSAVLFFLLFERRTFCRYICPLSTLIGTVGSVGSVAGFRTKDREVCLSCRTKDCMRGGKEGFGCPWYTWPGSADSNLYCGLCSECYKACPEGNVGLFLQKPLTSVVSPRRRRADVAWGVALLWGLVLYQQYNATNVYADADNWLNNALGFPHYPDPVDFFAFIALAALATAGVAWLVAKAFSDRSTSFALPGRQTFVDRTSQFRAFFLPIAYGLIPVVGADYFARQLPKFFKHAARLAPAVEHIAGFSSVRSPMYSVRILSSGWIVVAQVAVVLLGTFASLVATWRIAGRELVPVSRDGLGVRLATTSFVLACGAAAAVLYVLMHAAS
jgi:NosR/NirI family nitrous oxide reductase transcriptional regulator